MQDASAPPPSWSPLSTLALIVTVLLCFASAWMLPLRLAFESGNSYYSAILLSDETLYAECMQPLMPGATRANPVNGWGDPNYRSVFFLEDAVREVLKLTGVPVVDAYWIWRFFFPALIFAAFFLVAREVLQRKPERSSPALAVLLAALATSLLFLEPLCFRHRAPSHGWLLRLPTNIEFLLSVLLLWQYLRFDRMPTSARAAWVSVHFALLFYLRVYAAVPWALALALGVVFKLARKELGLMQLAVGMGTLLIALAPWAILFFSNRELPVYAEISQRFFQTAPWELHRQASWYLTLSLPFFAAGYWMSSSRFVLLACGGTLVLLPLVSGMLPFGVELSSYDRSSSFYLVALAAAALLWVSRWDLALKRMQFAALGAAALLAIVGVHFYQKFDYRDAHWSVFRDLRSDTAAVPAYEWIAKNTPADALILEVQPTPHAEPVAVTAALNDRTADLLCVVTQRRLFYSGRLCVAALTNAELLAIARFNAVVFSDRLTVDETLAGLKKYGVTHVFLRKVDGAVREIPTGMRPHLKLLHSDTHCDFYSLQW